MIEIVAFVDFRYFLPLRYFIEWHHRKGYVDFRVFIVYILTYIPLGAANDFFFNFYLFIYLCRNEKRTLIRESSIGMN